MKVVKKGVVAYLNGRVWSEIYSDGHSTAYGFALLGVDDGMGIPVPQIANPKYCKRPEDLTYATSPNREKLKKAELREIIITTTYEVK